MHEENETPNTSDRAHKEPVIIIHGTAAATASWWRPGSRFCKKLDAALAKRGSAACCWAGLQAEDFKWSGNNSEYQRSLAADAMVDRLVNTFAQADEGPVHLVAHSHGGNVLIKTLTSNPHLRPSSIVLLGTPLYHYSSTQESFSSQNIIRESTGGLFLSLSLLFLPLYLFQCLRNHIRFIIYHLASYLL